MRESRTFVTLFVFVLFSRFNLRPQSQGYRFVEVQTHCAVGCELHGVAALTHMPGSLVGVVERPAMAGVEAQAKNQDFWSRIEGGNSVAIHTPPPPVLLGVRRVWRTALWCGVWGVWCVAWLWLRAAGANALEQKNAPLSALQVVATATLVHDEPTNPVYACTVSPNGKLYVTGGRGVVKVWNAASCACVRTLCAADCTSSPPDAAPDRSPSLLDPRTVFCCAFSPNGSRLAAASKDSTVAMWRVSDWEVERVLRGHGGTVTSCAWSNDGTWLVTGGSDNTVTVWRVADGSVVHTLKGHANWVFDVCFSPDDTMVVASVSDDSTMKVWRVGTGGDGGGCWLLWW